MEVRAINTVVERDIQEIIGDSHIFKDFQGKTILVTGATGLIGSMVARSLVAANEAYHLSLHVICHVRNIEKAHYMFGDILTSDAITFVDVPLESLDIACDYIMHGAAPTKSKYFVEHPVDTIRTSIHGTERMLELGKEQHIIGMVYLSSMEQYGVPYESGQVMTEDCIGILDHLNVRSSYSESKRLCECYCKSYAVEFGVPVKIARLAQTFGAGVPLDDNRVFMQFTQNALEKNDIILHTKGDSMSNFCYITDAVRAILILMSQGEAGEAYNVCHDEETRSIASIANLVACHVGGDKISVVFDIPDNVSSYGYAPTVHMFLNSRKMRNLLWEPQVTMKEAYIRLSEYIKEERHHE